MSKTSAGRATKLRTVRARFNGDVMTALEDATKHAKEAGWHFVAVVGVSVDGTDSFCSAPSDEYARLIGSIELLKARLIEERERHYFDG